MYTTYGSYGSSYGLLESGSNVWSIIALVLAIVGVVIAFVVQAKNNAGVSGGDNTTTTTTTAEKTTIGTITNTTSTAVEIEWRLDTPVRNDIYEYIVNG